MQGRGAGDLDDSVPESECGHMMVDADVSQDFPKWRTFAPSATSSPVRWFGFELFGTARGPLRHEHDR